ncbi:hypothetical protein H0O01_00860 [Candidatus Micrarchaeota archaeon]|nr:hypothetical protein [Candidatus Micrarchaeota archaeon]
MAGPYGKPLFFSKLQMIPVKEEPVAEQKPETGGREPEAGSRKRKTK